MKRRKGKEKQSYYIISYHEREGGRLIEIANMHVGTLYYSQPTKPVATFNTPPRRLENQNLQNTPSGDRHRPGRTFPSFPTVVVM